WDEASDFKRPPMWPSDNDTSAQTLMGKADSVLKGAVTEAKKALGQTFTNPSSIMRTIDTAKQLKENGASALLPMVQQGVESHLTSQLTNFTS
ncbi:hypothetical protein, partial [Acinetobacter baumannii]